MAARRERRIAVQVRRFHVLQRIFTAADVERVAVGQKRHAAAFFDHVGHGFGVIRTQKSEIAQFAEVELDGDKLSLKINLVKTGREQELFQLHLLRNALAASKIGKINLGWLHHKYLHTFFGNSIFLFCRCVKRRASG